MLGSVHHYQGQDIQEGPPGPQHAELQVGAFLTLLQGRMGRRHEC